MDPIFTLPDPAMDLTTAKNLRDNLMMELNTYRSYAISEAPYLLAMEIYRLDQDIEEGFQKAVDTLFRKRLRFTAENYRVRIGVENPSLIVDASNRLGFRDIPSLEHFRFKLTLELPQIKNFNQPLPLIYQFTQRVIERVDDEIFLQRYAETLHSYAIGQSPYWPHPPRSHGRSKAYDLDICLCIHDAIKSVFVRNEGDASSDQVIDLLEENEYLVLEWFDISLARQMYFEFTFPRSSHPAPGGYPRL